MAIAALASARVLSAASTILAAAAPANPAAPASPGAAPAGCTPDAVGHVCASPSNGAGDAATQGVIDWLDGKVGRFCLLGFFVALAGLAITNTVPAVSHHKGHAWMTLGGVLVIALFAGLGPALINTFLDFGRQG
jgi:hypothetical protein